MCSPAATRPAIPARDDEKPLTGRRLEVAIVGAGGMIAELHRRGSLLAGASVSGVLASTPQRSREVADKWRVENSYADIAEVAASAVDVVHICTPNATHAPYVEAVLAAGKHVVCEKPLGISLDEAQRMAELADRAGVVATVPFVYRYHPVVRELRARAQAGAFGSWNLLHGQYLQDWLLSSKASNWRVDPAQGGASRAFADIGSHWCDLVEWVSGTRFETLIAQFNIAVSERNQVSGPSFSPARSEGDAVAVATEDSATVMMRTSNGVPGSLVVSQVAAGRKNRLWFELDGSAGSAVFDQGQPESFWAATADGSERVVRDPNRGSAEQRRLSFLPAGHAQGYDDCFAGFVADTYAAIEGAKPDGLPTFVDGLRSARIVDAVVRSSRTSSWTEI
jgi:predicted dehydrogenase